LTLSICETLLNQSGLHRAALRTGERKPPDHTLVERRWNNQFSGHVRMQITTPFVAAAHFSVVAALRCEVQAVDQHWSQHRVAINLKNGESDPQLAEQLAILEPWNDPLPIDWPKLNPEQCRTGLLAALEREALPAVKSIRDRQLQYLQRELATVDRFYRDYEENLASRLNRSRSDSGRAKMQERLEAARQEHQIRRIDQIKRHEIRVNAHVDALLIIAEPSYRTRIQYVCQRREHQCNALWVPRARSWVVEDENAT
jgi:hypothetical protein